MLTFTHDNWLVLSFALCWVGQEPPPPVEGDLNLVRVLLDAQQANLDRFSSGELRARFEQWGLSAPGAESPTLTMHVRLVWSGEKAYWEFDQDVRERKDIGNKDLLPVYGRIVFDGREYAKHVAGDVQLFTNADFEKVGLEWDNLDLRPTGRWTKPRGRGRPWAELLGPHPNFPSDAVQKWVFKQDGDRVLIERHDRYKDGTEGLTRIVTSLDLAGNVVEVTYRGSQSRDYKYVWRKDGASRVILERETIRVKYEDGSTVESELTVMDFQVRDTVPSAQFEIAALQIPTGTWVHDRIRNRRYRFEGLKVDQKTLDNLAEELKARNGESGSNK